VDSPGSRQTGVDSTIVEQQAVARPANAPGHHRRRHDVLACARVFVTDPDRRSIVESRRDLLSAIGRHADAEVLIDIAGEARGSPVRIREAPDLRVGQPDTPIEEDGPVIQPRQTAHERAASEIEWLHAARRDVDDNDLKS
jgi:hypothetical protein